MYTKTYIFGETTTVGYLLGTGDRFLLTIQFTIEGSESSATYLAESKGLKLAKRGKTGMSFDFDQWFLVPNEYELVIADTENEFSDLLYDGADVHSVQKEFYAKLEIKYLGNANYETEFSGHNVVEALDHPPFEKLHYFTILPRTNILNETYLYPLYYDKGVWDDGKPETEQPNNPLSLIFNRSGDCIKWDWIKLSDSVNNNGLLQKIFQLINEDITVDVFQDWLFYGDSYIEYGVGYNYQKDDLKFTDLILDHNWIGSVFAYQNQNIESIGDLLTLLAFEYGCLAGFASEERGFFKQMFYWDENNVEEMGNLCMDGYKKSYKYEKIDYAEINSINYKQDSGKLNRYVEQDFNPRGYAPNELFEKVSGRTGLTKSIVSVADYNNTMLSGAWEYCANLKAAIDGVSNAYYNIYGVKHPYLTFNTITWNPPKAGYLGLCHFLAEYNYTLKGLLYKTQVHEFKYDGLYYDFMKGFQKDGYNFSKVGQEKDWDAETTTIEAIRIELAEKDIDNSSQGTTVTVPVSVISMKVVPGSVALSYTQVASGAIPIAVMNAGEWLKGFFIQIEVAFNADEISDFRVYDGSGTLFTKAKVMGKFLTVVDPQAIVKVKQYTAADTIYLEWTQGTNTPSVGQGTLIIEKMVNA